MLRLLLRFPLHFPLHFPLLIPLFLGLPCAGGAQAATTVHFVIDLRAEIAAQRFDPRRDRLGLRGDAPPLSWSRSLQADDADADGHYELTLQLDEAPFGGQALAYKFKLEHPADPDGGWESGPNHALLLRPPAQRVERRFNAEPVALAPSRTGRIERLAAQPSQHVSTREVQVWLPPGYTQQAPRRYPVLYLHDGQNVFDSQAAGNEWQFDETAQRLVEAGAIEPAIIVAVASTATRIADYTPGSAVLGAGAAQGGGVAAYARYLVQELKPFIDTRYRTQAGAASTAVGGSSIGGLATLWLLLHHADSFGAGLVVSPAVWWNSEAILHELAAAAPAPARPRVWLDIGLQEPGGAVQGARRLRATLLQQGWSPEYTEQPGGRHDEASWAARVEGMLRFLYAPR